MFGCFVGFGWGIGLTFLFSVGSKGGYVVSKIRVIFTPPKRHSLLFTAIRKCFVQGVGMEFLYSTGIDYCILYQL